VEDVAHRVVAGNLVPDHSTIAEFRVRHEAALAELFTGVLGLCRRVGLVSVGVVAIDGTKIAGNASREANRSYEQTAREIPAEAAETDRREDELYGEARGDELPERLRTSEGRKAALREAKEKLERERRAGEQRAKTDEQEGAAVEVELDPDRFVTRAEGRRAWLREGRRGLDEQREREARPVAIEEVAGADVVVTTYTLFRLEADAYGTVPWAGLILDEAQFVKNHQAKTYRCVRELATPFKLAITGTPIENNLMELWSLLSITAPGLFPDPKRFTEQYARPIERGGDSERLARLRRRIKPLVKRRTKELVAADLPPKQEQILDVDLHPRHRKLYDTHLQRERQKILGLIGDFDRNRFTILRSITVLRQLSLHPGLVDDRHDTVPCAKLSALVEQLADVVGGGHRALVFSQFTGFLSKVRERLDGEDIDYCYLDGRTRRRDRVLERFKEGTDPVFLISLKAGGFGLNLTEADYCFLLDPWWNLATEVQAIDRTHRIGQTRPVMVYRTIARDTIEEKVVALARRKAALFSGVMDDGDLFATSLTAADIRGLLG